MARERFIGPASILTAASLLLALVAVGCGGSDREDSTRTSLTRAEFAKQGNAICEKGLRKTLKVASTVPPNPSPAEIRKYVFGFEIPHLRKEIGELAALDAPPAYRDTVEQMVTTSDAAIDDLRANPELIKSLVALLAPTTALAWEIGLTTCGSTGV